MIDDKAEKYYQVTPYMYALNNPILLLDPDGNEVVDANGKEITYSKKDGWSRNATDAVKHVYSTLMMTEKGQEQWNKAVSSSNKLRFNLSDETLSSEKNKLTLGTSAIPDQMNPETGIFEFSPEIVIDITLYMGSIKESILSNTDNKGLGIREATGATAGHEIEHATNEENINDVVYNSHYALPGFKKDTESVCDEVDRAIREEIKSKKLKLMKPRLTNAIQNL